MLNTLGCGADEVSCLTTAEPEDLIKSVPEDWTQSTSPKDRLPEKDEEPDHSWLTLDKYILFQNPLDYWREHRLSNTVAMVIGESPAGYSEQNRPVIIINC